MRHIITDRAPLTFAALPLALAVFVSLFLLSVGCNIAANDSSGGETANSDTAAPPSVDDDDEDTSPSVNDDDATSSDVGETTSDDDDAASNDDDVTSPTDCAPDCTGRECGDDGCGGSCGSCLSGSTCFDAGLCVADDAEMVRVPAGEFIMGCNQPDCSEGANPAMRVYLSAFEIDRYEVTAWDYTQCMDAGVCNRLGGPLGEKEQSFLPAYGPNFYQPIDYCNWKGKRLPTSAEWEKAARGTDGRIFPWGNHGEVPSSNFRYRPVPSCEYANIGRCNANCDGRECLERVDSRPQNVSPYGVYQMIGNAPEFVFELDSSILYDGVVDPGREMESSDVSQKGDVSRGGGVDFDGSIQTTLRVYDTLRTVAYNFYGFRCARSVDE